MERWDLLAHRLHVPFQGDGVLGQFEGYEGLRELDWDRYRAKHGNIERLDLILAAEHDSANSNRVAKQGDVPMLLYVFGQERLIGLLRIVGYEVTEG